jgi:hypothetical protein
MRRELKIASVEQSTFMFSPSAPYSTEKFSPSDETYYFKVHFSAAC